MTKGVRYGDYLLLGKLSQGGMAEIFLAISEESDKKGQLFAVKRTLPDYGDDAEFVSMFMDELRISASLVHENIVEVHQTGRNDQQLFLVMEFLHGKDLRMINRRLAKKGEDFPPRLAAYTLCKIALALEYAHSHVDPQTGDAQELVHRDVNPQNIIVSYDGTPKLIDFGIAKAKDRISKTRVGVLKGKFSYLSPEQVLGAEVDGRSDVFAMGVVLYRLLTGRCPFEAGTEPALLLKISQGDYPLPNTINKELPEQLCEVVVRALATEPDQRYQSAKELADELGRFLALGTPVSEEDLGAFVKGLFESQYERELRQLGKYIALPDPESTGEASDPVDEKDPFVEPTVAIVTSRGSVDQIVGAATTLAAGYELESGKYVVSSPGISAGDRGLDPQATVLVNSAGSGPLSPEALLAEGSVPNPSSIPGEEVSGVDLNATLAMHVSDISDALKQLGSPTEGRPTPSPYEEEVETVFEPRPIQRMTFVLSKAELLALGIALVIGLSTIGVTYHLTVGRRGGDGEPTKTQIKELTPANTPGEAPN